MMNTTVKPARQQSDGVTSTSYLDRLLDKPLLSAADENRLALRARAGDERARTYLIEANMRLVISIVKGYRHLSIPFEDLVQEGAIGLLSAVERFDPNMGYRFSTYATYWIRQAVGRAIDNKARSIRLPAHISEKMRKLERLRAETIRLTGVEPTITEMALEVGLRPSVVEWLLQTGMEPLSLDSLVGQEDGTSLGSLIDDKNALNPEKEAIRADIRIQLTAIVDQLNERERGVMRRRLGLEENSSGVLQDIGKEMRLSRERVRQIEVQALRKMRRLSHQIQDLVTD